MDKDGKNQRACPAPEPELLLQWGNRKRLRCVKVRDGGAASEKPDGPRRTKTRINRRVIKSDKDSLLPCPWLPHPSSSLHRKSESGASECNRKSPSSPEKEDGRFYATRGSTAGQEENGHGGGGGDERGGFGCGVGEEKVRGRWVLPRFFISLSSKEKEEDFMAMKGCKLPQRPKKRTKFIQKIILLVSPGAGLSDLSQERYEVREKKNTRKRRRGLKAISMESDSE
ncbi:hypothetical protein Taro_044880 [Colocasia esculenta]|uniref:Uncharacterized protein n=1 Tax=Colocasia esculenta TaxID=4460 RepID=A0A843WPT9_COLES|nr:hypothetical protein [Colocasia esculenta]